MDARKWTTDLYHTRWGRGSTYGEYQCLFTARQRVAYGLHSAITMDTIIFPLTNWVERNSAVLLISMAFIGMVGLLCFGAV